MEATLIMGERDHAPLYADSVIQGTHLPYPVHRRLRGPQNLSGRRGKRSCLRRIKPRFRRLQSLVLFDILTELVVFKSGPL